MNGPVTRVEIAVAVETAFVASRDPGRTELLVAARAAGSRSAVVQVLERLPERSYNTLRALWPHLPATPIGEPPTPDPAP
jgi:hypothetical protein